MTVTTKLDLGTLVVPHVESQQVWADFIEAFNAVLASNVDGPIKQLENLRNLTQDTDPVILTRTARDLGFDISQDVLSMSESNLLRLVTQLPMYPDKNSTEEFPKFLDLLLNAVTNVAYLYTRDYVNFVETPGGPLIDQDGVWFKTTHVTIDIALLNDKLELQPGQTIFQRTKELFYQFAPITLVIEHLNYVIIIRDSDWLGGSAFGIGVYMIGSDVELIVE